MISRNISRALLTNYSNEMKNPEQLSNRGRTELEQALKAVNDTISSNAIIVYAVGSEGNNIRIASAGEEIYESEISFGIDEKEDKGIGKWAKVPLVRGVVSFVSSMIIGIQSLMFSAQFFEDEDDKAGDSEPVIENNDNTNVEKEVKNNKTLERVENKKEDKNTVLEISVTGNPLITFKEDHNYYKYDTEETKKLRDEFIDPSDYVYGDYYITICEYDGKSDGCFANDMYAGSDIGTALNSVITLKKVYISNGYICY